MRRFGLVLLLALGAGCQGCPGPAPLVRPSKDAGAQVPFDGGTATCLDYCRRGQEMGCTWAADTDLGVPCSTVCANNQTVAISPWDLDCRVRQPTCSAVDANCW